MNEFTIRPVLGLKTDVAADDPSLFKQIGENDFLTHDTGGLNTDYQRQDNACSKAYGTATWTTAAVGTPARVQGMFELYDGTNRNNIFFEQGLVYKGQTPTQLDISGGGLTLGDANAKLFCAIRFGSYIVFTDFGDTTPYKWKHGDANLTKLILSGTEFKFRYLIEWQRRIIGAYSGQTNGDIEIRWTDSLPTWASLDFGASNQLYKPGTDSITGVSALGSSAVLVYGTESISRLNYYSSATAPFGFTTLVQGQGAANHHSIVNAQGANWFFSKNYGFVKYMGASQILSRDVISKDIDGYISDIDSRYYVQIVGKYIPHTHEICWTVPQGSAAVPSHLLFYHIPTGNWRREDKAYRYIDAWTRTAGEHKKLVMGNADGYIYSYEGSDLNDADAYDAYRIEPILDFGLPTRTKYINAIWLGATDMGTECIDLYHRSGRTTEEVLLSTWDTIGTFPCPEFKAKESALFPLLSGKLHQFKWGSDAAGQEYSINRMTFKFTVGGEY